MFDFSVIHESVAKKQREGVNSTLATAMRSQTLTSTAVLMAPEPLRTMALEYLDGYNSESGKPETSGDPKALDPVLLICRNPTDTIKVFSWATRSIYGTNVQAPPQKVTKDLGPIAMVDNSFPTRYARNVLRSRGWPVRDVLSRGANSGAVIEWRWLELEAKKDDAPPELKEIYEELLPRVEAFRKPETQLPIKAKSAGGNQQSAHP